MTKQTALITGASSGIGLELAKIFANNSINLVLVARRLELLEQLKHEISSSSDIDILLIAADLAQPNAAQVVFDKIKEHQLQINYLINNAGFGSYGYFVQTDWKTSQDMIQVNIQALSQFTFLGIKHMQQHGGRIMNIASTAAFQPGPLMAVYFATKAYVLSFTEALSNEYANANITFTTLCPGATHSEFFNVANMHESRLVKGRKLPTSAEVAYFGYQAMMKGKVVAIHGLLNKIMAKSVGFFPRSWVLKITRFIQDKS